MESHQLPNNEQIASANGRSKKHGLTLFMPPQHEGGNPEAVLMSLGFVPDDPNRRIPDRFLHQSIAKGIKFDYNRILGE